MVSEKNLASPLSFKGGTGDGCDFPSNGMTMLSTPAPAPNSSELVVAHHTQHSHDNRPEESGTMWNDVENHRKTIGKWWFNGI